MSKAYDRVEWMFVVKVMKRLGFNDKYIGLIIKYISTVSYSVLINGEAHGSIVPSRRLRQGDTLSSYLFLLCTKAFSALIADSSSKHVLKGISICRSCPKVTHLFFADDSLLFCGARSQECHKVVEILQQYEAASRQKVNTDKSSILFNHNTAHEARTHISEILGPMQDSRPNKYLGLSSVIGKSKIKCLQKLKKRWARNWSDGRKKYCQWG